MAAKENLPFLPGYVVDTNVRTDFRKTHHFDVNEAAVHRPRRRAAPANACDALEQRQMTPGSTARLPQVPTKKPPAWLRFAGQVARFYAYVHEPKDRIRRFILYYYMEDSSLQVSEDENSTLTTSNLQRKKRVAFLRRHRVPHADGERFVASTDLAVGQTVTLYSRSFFIYDADQFTRSWYADELGISLREAVPCPVDAVDRAVEKRQMQLVQGIEAQRRNGGVCEFVESALGRPSRWHLRESKRFFDGFGTVLRFWVVVDLDDSAQQRSLSGDRVHAVSLDSHPLYVLHFFCCDNTAEIVLDKSQRGKSEEIASTLIKRQRIPRRFLGADCASFGGNELAFDTDSKYLSAGDFRVGQHVEVFGRRVLLLRADGATKAFYDSCRSSEDLRDVIVRTPGEPVHEVVKPPLSEIGSEADFLAVSPGSVPASPERDEGQRSVYQSRSLRFIARLHNAPAQQRHRRFVVVYHLADDTIAVFEQRPVLSGTSARKLFHKAVVARPDGSSCYSFEDMARGNVLCINGLAFELLQPDEFTHHFLKALERPPTPAPPHTEAPPHSEALE